MTATNHSWCRDVQRDEAVRAAEDNRQGPLPTLEEAIANPFTKTARICETESAVEPVIPAADAQGGGGGGLRTERVTLEVTQRTDAYAPPSEIDWESMLRRLDRGGRRQGESVRVVEEANAPGLRLLANNLRGKLRDCEGAFKRVDDERYAAIRERDKWRTEAEKATALGRSIEAKQAYFRQSRDDARTQCERLTLRVAELESQLESVACRAATAETRVSELEAAPAANGAEHVDLQVVGAPGWTVEVTAGNVKSIRIVKDADEFDPKTAPAASGAANSPAGPKSSEPVAWGVMNGDGSVYEAFADDEVQKQQAIELAQQSREMFGLTDLPLAPLFASPPPARGWLMEEEREALDDYTGRGVRSHRSVEIIKALLARETPPEVEVPVPVSGWTHRDHAEGWVRAIRAAGVAVKEVGRE